MNRFVLGFADGTSFFAGVTAVLLADLLLVRFRTGFAAALLSAVVLAGIVVVVISATPLPVWAYTVWLGACSATLLLCRRQSTRKTCIASAGVLLVTTMGICAAEIPYHRVPQLSVEPGEIVYVVGDSLSAGTGMRERCWPLVLGDMTQLAVVNLAEPGATVRSAMVQANRATQANAVVILEIGGNDLLNGSDAALFRERLDSLVCSLYDHRAILMFELPLFPFQNAFGRAQREVAAKYGVILIPKSCLTSILGLNSGTLDGLHLSQTGHNALARRVAEFLRIEDGTLRQKRVEKAHDASRWTYVRRRSILQ